MYRYNDLQATDNTPSLSYAPGATQQNPSAASATSGWSLASFLYGQPSSGTYTVPAAVALQYFYTAAYIQDDWRVNSRLTLNIGLRYDLETPFTERYNRLSHWDPGVAEAATQRLPSAVGGLQPLLKFLENQVR
jgi:outer membrane receptor protein involved in Fe transport